MSMTPSEAQMAHRRRKRDAGLCMYGGCRRRWTTRSGFCAKHMAQKNDASRLNKMRKRTSAELMELRTLHANAIQAIDDVMAERKGSADQAVRDWRLVTGGSP